MIFEKKILKSQINRCQNTLTSLLFYLFLKSAPLWKLQCFWMRRDEHWRCINHSAVLEPSSFAPARSRANTQTQTRVHEFLLTGIRNNLCCLVALLSARTGGASTRFHFVTSVRVRLYRFRVQTEAALLLQWVQTVPEGGETSDTCVSFCPLQNHQILGCKALKLEILVWEMVARQT